MTTTVSHVHGTTSAIGRTMPAATKDIGAERKTWQDLWPDEPADVERLLTRRDLAERAQAQGVAISERDIANWQSLGVLPRGIGQRAGRALQMLYPERYINLLRDVREEQRKGARLAAIGPLLWVRHAGKPQDARESVVFSIPTATATGEAHAPTITGRAHVRRGDPALTANDELAQTLRTIAREHEKTYGRTIARVELRLIDDHGNPLTLAVDTD